MSTSTIEPTETELEQREASSARQTTSRRRLLAVCLSVAAAAYILWWILNRSRPELLMESEKSFGSFIRDGWVYSTYTDALVARNIETGAKRQTTLFDQSQELVGSLQFTDDAAYFTVQPKQKRELFGGGGSVGGGASMGSSSAPSSRPLQDLGYYLLHERAQLPPGATRTVTEYTIAPVLPGELRRVSLRDGTLSTLRVDTLGEPIQHLFKVFVRGTMYWFRNKDRRLVTITTPKGYWHEYPATSELMASPLDGGPPRKVFSGIYRSGLGNSRDVICWNSPRLYPDKRVDLHYFDPESGLRGVIPSYSHNVTSVRIDPVSFKGRLYWLTDAPPGRPKELLTIAPGESAPRAVFQPVVRDKVIPLSLSTQGGKLLLLYRTFQEAVVQPDSSVLTKPPPPYLAVLEPEAKDPIQRTTGPLTGYAEASTPGSQPETLWLEGDSVYYMTSEWRKDTFDFLQEAATEKLIYTLYRAPLR